MAQSSATNSTGSGQGTVFWLLVALGLIGVAPCVLLPEWRQYEALVLAEQVEAYRLHELAAVVERDKAAYDALCDDPAVVARLAQRELHFERANERIIPVAAMENAASPRSTHLARMSRSGLRWTPDDSFVPDSVWPPPVLAGAIAALPAFDYDAVFCDDRTRSIIMAMSFGLIVLAFALFGRSQRPVDAGDRSR